MKRIFLLPVLLVTGFVATAQNYEEAKNLLLLMQLPKAKEAVDKGMTNAKYAAKPEAYILKATIYSSMATDVKFKDLPEGDKYLADAEAAWNKYKEMDPSLAYLKDLAYQNAPINIYSGYFNSGYKDYQAKKWQQGFEKFKKVVDLSDMLIKEKIINIAVADTNSILLAGILAENSKLEPEAAKYYARIAELKLNTEDYEGIYRYLVKYSFQIKDMAAFEKYRALGKQLYPKSDYFNYDKVDFAIGLEDNFNKKVVALEDALQTNPNNTKALELLGEIIYDTIYSTKEGAVPPANAAELAKKMESAFKKLGELEPNNEISFLFLGNHHITRSINTDNIKTAFEEELKKKNKPGVKISAADQAKKDALEQEYAIELENARDPFEKVAAIFSKKEKMTNMDKVQYKKIVGYLADIYSFKKSRVKNNPADLAKFTTEEKKWNDLYETITGNSSTTQSTNTQTTVTGKGNIPLVKDGGVYKIKNCKVNDVLNWDMILDTGASTVSISLVDALYMLNHGNLKKDEIIGTNQYSTADGSIHEGYSIIIRKIDLGSGIVLTNVKASVTHSLGAPILLGLSALTQFSSMTIDNNKLLLIVK